MKQAFIISRGTEFASARKHQIALRVTQLYVSCASYDRYEIRYHPRLRFPSISLMAHQPMTSASPVGPSIAQAHNMCKSSHSSADRNCWRRITEAPPLGGSFQSSG